MDRPNKAPAKACTACMRGWFAHLHRRQQPTAQERKPKPPLNRHQNLKTNKKPNLKPIYKYEIHIESNAESVISNPSIASEVPKPIPNLNQESYPKSIPNL